MNITLNLPDEIVKQLGGDVGDVPRRILEAVALEGYRSDKFSRGQVSDLLRLDFWATEEFLKAHQATLAYSSDDLDSDVAANERTAQVIIVVSDTGPMNYLLLAGCVDVLPRLYDQVVLPSAVLAELSHPAAPPVVQAWLKKLPAWATVQTPARVDPTLKLGRGEAEAICLAEELKAAEVLLDERKGRKIAAERGLVVTGTLGILATAGARDFIDLTVALAKLKSTNFRLDPKVIRHVLEREAERRKQK